MLITTTQNLTFEEYLTYDDDTDTRYELVEGQLIPMTPPILQHYLIARFLMLMFESAIKRANLPYLTLLEAGQRTGIRNSRLPDLLVIPITVIEELRFQPAIFESAALLAVEVVSPSSVEDDYISKRDEYQAIGIPEYWVVDAISENPRITIHTLTDDVYHPNIFSNAELLISPTFLELQVTAEQILNA
ncbi:Uma2 family endonuclease [Synechococcus sp. PCC 6312]|uniref:Uma2 family endonuclease n=1 Tax=Synechococcus sp. (strain ATCC 27167 / PCC 6312) TaxID=195253 RepID=UPI00029F2802|nr:Uma2 family endonuclease [Synechococcus sp. PCC 6312]AFY60007.1 hypothetical protein Syn6312_0792 [Synechococcus sp. PCC 6312]